MLIINFIINSETSSAVSGLPIWYFDMNFKKIIDSNKLYKSMDKWI